MNKPVLDQMRRDCLRIMWPCYLLNGFRAILELAIPTLTAWLLGDMADALLRLDTQAIYSRMIPFGIAVFLEAVVYQLINMASDLLIVRRAGAYQNFLMGRLLHRPLAALHEESGASVAEHLMEDAPVYYFIRIWKFILPVLCLVYGSMVLGTFTAQSMNPLFAGAILLLAAVPVVKSAFLGGIYARLNAAERDYEIDRSESEETLFRGRTFFRVNHLESMCVHAFHEKYLQWMDQYGAPQIRFAALRTVLDYISNYGTSLAVILVGAVGVYLDQMTVGELMTGYLMLPTLTKFYYTLSDQIEDLKQERDAEARLTVFYGNDAEGEIPETCPPVKEIRLNDVCFSYPGADRDALEHRMDRFSDREQVRLIGENGAGKTTLVMVLSGLYPPKSGTVTDEYGNTLPVEQLRRLVSVQPQDGSVFEGAVWENLFLEKDRQAEAAALLQELGFEKDLEDRLDAHGSNLSPGERQKLLSARAILRNCPFLVMDEPLNHMDAKGTEKLLSILHSRKGLVVISHQNAGMDFLEHRRV